MMGMYLMRSIGLEGVYHSHLPDFMVFLDWKALPWYWHGTEHFALCRAPGDTGSGFARLDIRVLCFPLASQRCLPVNYHPGLDVCGHALCSTGTRPGLAGTMDSPISNGSSVFRSLRLGTRAGLFMITFATLVGRLPGLQIYRHLETGTCRDGRARHRIASDVSGL